MRFGSVFAKAGFVVLAGLLALASGCSKSTSPASTTNTGGGTGPSFDFSYPTNGISHVFTFPDAGSWTYHCNIHSFMTGTVVVDASSVNDSAVVSVGAGGATVFAPASVTIHPNGHVRFVSVNEAVAHTASR